MFHRFNLLSVYIKSIRTQGLNISINALSLFDLQFTTSSLTVHACQ
jgi:hypothetical protein